MLRSHELLTGEVDAPLALCSVAGELLSLTPAASRLLQRLDILAPLPALLPLSLWRLVESVQSGESVTFPPLMPGDVSLECTRYDLRRGGSLLWLREAAEPRRTPVDIMPLQRQAATGRLMASVAHDVRSSVASIIYSADFLEARGAAMKEDTLRDTVRDICEASRRLQLTVDGLLDYARLGPAISVPVSLHEVLNRVQSILRSFYRGGARRLRVELPRGADWVRGNPVVIEQIFVNLLLLAAECVEEPGGIVVAADVSAPSALGLLQARVAGDGCVLRLRGASEGSAMGLESPALRMSLLDARAAAESQGGRLLLEESEDGRAFVVQLPRSEGPR